MRRLGLDVGTNSIGWALFDIDEKSEASALVDGGVLIFPDGRNPKDKNSNAMKRREKRGPRRNRDRGLRRRKLIDHILTSCGLLPTAPEQRDVIFKRDPWALRAKALDEALEPYELGRALWSFHDRRGFKSNRKTDKADDTGKMKQDILFFAARMDAANARTLGEFLHKRKNNRRHKKGRSIRARLGNGLYPDRSMIEHELAAIRKVQEAHHENLSNEDWNAIVGTILYQRPLKPVEIGKCTLEPGETRAHRALPTFQRYRILADLVNLEFARPGEKFARLSYEDFHRLYLTLLQKKDRTFEQARTMLGLPEGTRFNLQTTQRTKLDGDLMAVNMAAKKRWGPDWRKLPLVDQDRIITRLIHEENEQTLKAWLVADYAIGEDRAEAIMNCPLPPGTGNFCYKVLSALVPVLADQGLHLADAVKEIGYDSHSAFHHDGSAPKLPYYGAVLERSVMGADATADPMENPVKRYGKVSNPTVHIAMGQLQRLFNEITDRYGKPNEVVIELARDLKRSLDDKKKMMRLNKSNQDRNDRLKSIMEEAGQPFSGHILRKLQLWDEQRENSMAVAQCPFTGQTISVAMALSAATEIEHLLPFSRSLDDSKNNKVLVIREANREKGKRTPWEWRGDNPDIYHAMMERAASLLPNKVWRFAPDAWQQFEAQGDFLSRQLNETRYLSRMMREYLTTVVHKDKISITPGHLTAMLRGKWGLNSLLGDSNKKERLDHRHHLIDAVVVGLTTRSMLNRVSRASAQAQNQHRLIADMPDPWGGFRNDVRVLIDRTIVHFKPNHAKPSQGATTGALHNDTAFGLVDGPDDKGMHTLVYRKTIDSLGSPGKLETIRDDALRQKLQKHWDHFAKETGTEQAKWQKFSASCSMELNVRSVRVFERLSADSIAIISDKNGNAYKAYKTDGNAFMDVWLLPDGKTRGETVTRFDAHQKDHKSAIKAEFPTAKKLMRLHINDMVAVGEGDERRILRVQSVTGQSIVMVDHNEAGNLRERERTKDLGLKYTPLRRSAGQIIQTGLRKISVSRTGVVRDGGPYKA